MSSEAQKVSRRRHYRKNRSKVLSSIAQKNAKRRYYEKNKRTVSGKAQEQFKKYRAEIKMYVRGYLSEHPCIDCGEADPIILEFDHRERGSKLFAIAEATHKHRKLRDVIEEIEKCDVRCANCHRRKTHREHQKIMADRKRTGDSMPLTQFDLFERR